MIAPFDYKFAFNNDVDSCQALKSMIMSGWTLYAITVEDGHTWLVLHHEREKTLEQLEVRFVK